MHVYFFLGIAAIAALCHTIRPDGAVWHSSCRNAAAREQFAKQLQYNGKYCWTCLLKRTDTSNWSLISTWVPAESLIRVRRQGLHQPDDFFWSFCLALQSGVEVAEFCMSLHFNTGSLCQRQRYLPLPSFHVSLQIELVFLERFEYEISEASRVLLWIDCRNGCWVILERLVRMLKLFTDIVILEYVYDPKI